MTDNWNRNLDEAPKDGTELIFWVSSDKGFEDITANFYYLPEPKSEDVKRMYARMKRVPGWAWKESDAPLKRPDLVKGWMVYPQPPKEGTHEG